VTWPISSSASGAEEVAFGRDDVEVRGGAQVDDDRRSAVQPPGRDGVGDAVGAHLARVFDQQLDAGLDAGPDHHRPRAEVALGHLDELRRVGRHNRTDDHLVERLHGHVAFGAERAQQRRVLVGGADRVRPHAPRPDRVRAVVHAERGVRVVDVDREEHAGGPRLEDG